MHKLVGEAQTCDFQSRSIRDSLHLINYVKQDVGNEIHMGVSLITEDQSKVFDSVDLENIAAVLRAMGFDPDFMVGFQDYTVAFPRLFELMIT